MPPKECRRTAASLRRRWDYFRLSLFERIATWLTTTISQPAYGGLEVARASVSQGALAVEFLPHLAYAPR